MTRGRGLTALACLVVVAGTAGCSARPGAQGQRCATHREAQRAYDLGRSHFVITAPDKAEVVDDDGSGCSADSGRVDTAREYYWESLDPAVVIDFYRRAASREGWTTVTSTGEALDTLICVTRQIDGATAYGELSFPSSSPYGSLGDVYDVSAWIPTPSEPRGC